MNESFLPPQAALDLTRNILARTSGSPCQRLQDLACAYVDDELEAGQQSLVRSHLDICPSCAALVSALAMSEAALPSLVHLDPGPWFTQRLLRATVYQTGRQSAWWKLMHRPRIALEAAYLGAAAGLLGSYLPLPTPNFARVPAMVQPLSASVQRVVGQVVAAERRTTTSLQQGLVTKVSAPPTAAPAKSLWQRLSTFVKDTIQRFRKSAQPTAKAEEKTSKPTNP